MLQRNLKNLSKKIKVTANLNTAEVRNCELFLRVNIPVCKDGNKRFGWVTLFNITSFDATVWYTGMVLQPESNLYGKVAEFHETNIPYSAQTTSYQ